MNKTPDSAIKGILRLSAAALMVFFALSCSGSRNFKDILSRTGPVLAPLVITATDTSSITMAQPVFKVPSKPAGTVEAYIGVEGAIAVSGSDVTDFLDIPRDVSSGGYSFTGLDPFTTYTIVVVAQNELGYWVQSITQSTSAIAPAMNDLAVTALDSTSVTLAMPTFSVTGNPLPSVEAWIGVESSITVTGDSAAGYTVTNAVDGPVDVSSADAVFSGLSPATKYTIYVIAKNESCSVLKSITASTAAIVPVLNPLTIPSFDDTSIALSMPTFSTAGNPLPSVSAWIGVKGTIQLSGSSVSGSAEGPVNVAAQGYQFKNLAAGTTYTVIVVAQNSGGYDTASIDASTAIILPIMLPLTISAFDASSITLAVPSFSITGNPLPTVSAWIGIKGTIQLSGVSVSGSIQGPVDVSKTAHTFSGLDPDGIYTVYVIATNAGGSDIRLIEQRTEAVAPVMDDLSISSVESAAVTIEMPAFTTAGIPSPAVKGYIGFTSSITASGSTVTGASEGPVDISQQGYRFTGLSANKAYTLYAVAENRGGYSVKSAAVTTAAVAPVLGPLSISYVDALSITLAPPVLPNEGDPPADVFAYIGYKGTISASGSSVSSSLYGPIDVSSGGCTFSPLLSGMEYTIIVAASNPGGYSVQQINQNTASVAPVLRQLSISYADTSTITIAQPTFSTAGNPVPSVSAWIGTAGTISVTGSTVSGSLQGPVTAASGCSFTGLPAATMLQIVVIAQNSAGYDVKTIVQSTASIAPTLNPLAVSGADDTSIILDKPTFSIAGNPVPSVLAWIGDASVMKVTGTAVTGSLIGPVSAAGGSVQFSPLAAGGSYLIAVIAENSAGFDVRTITQSTSTTAPVLNPLVIQSAESSAITLAQPTFSAPGNPVPAVKAWIGLTGDIDVIGTTVTGALDGPYDVATGSHKFTGLSALDYTIIVTAQNSAGFSVMDIEQSLNFVAPVLNNLGFSAAPTADSITLAQPTFAVAGFPTPSVTAYIGLTGSIGYSGSSVTGTVIQTKDASSSSVKFTGLAQKTAYTVIVIAQNASGYSVKTIAQTTLSADKSILSFSIGGYACTIADPSITVNIPFWTNLDSLAAVFTTNGVAVSVGGIVQTSGTARDFNSPVAYTVTAEDGSTKNYTVTASNMGTVSTLALSTSAADGNEISAPMGMTNDSASLYLANTGLHTILKITSPGSSPVITRYAGQQGVSGTLDGSLLAATFTSPRGVGFGGNKLFIAEGAADIRRISPNLMKVQTSYSGLAGNPNDIAYDGSYIYPVIDGDVYTNYTVVMTKLTAASLGSLTSITYSGGYLYASDAGLNCIWKISTAGASTLFAGSGSASLYGAADGIGSAARFHHPKGITTDDTNLYVTDGDSQIIRKITLANARVRTIAGQNYVPGTSNGTGPAAQFSTPEGISIIGTTLYVVDSATGRIRKIE